MLSIGPAAYVNRHSNPWKSVVSLHHAIGVLLLVNALAASIVSEPLQPAQALFFGQNRENQCTVSGPQVEYQVMIMA